MADVTVMGAGIFGLSVAWSCLRRGARVRIVDPAGVAAGASGGPVGALAPHVPERWNAKKRFQFESLIMAERFWAEVAEASGLPTGYGRCGRLQPLADARALALARARARQAAALWQGRARWEVVAAAPAGAWAPASPTGWLVRDSLSARLDPPRAMAALAAALRTGGAEILPEAPPRGAVVWATGAAGLEALSRHFGRRFGSAVKGQAALLAHDAGPGAPQIYADGVHLVPHEGGRLAVGSTSERTFDSPDRVDGRLDEVLQRAARVVPALAGAEVIARWAGLRPRAISRAPLLGRWPGRAGHYIANGGFKIGFGVAPKVGAVMADLVLEGRDGIPAEFTPEALLAG